MHMINANDVRIGSVIKHNGKILKIKDKVHVKLDKGGACQKLQCEDVIKGGNMEVRLNVRDDIEEVFMSTKKLEFTYADDDDAHFTDPETFETVDIPLDAVGSDEFINLLKNYDNDDHAIEVLAQFIEIDGAEKCVGCALYSDIILTIDSTNPSIKGETAASSAKPAIAGGVSIKVPSHVNVGDKVLLSKADLSYLKKL